MSVDRWTTTTTVTHPDVRSAPPCPAHVHAHTSPVNVERNSAQSIIIVALPRYSDTHVLEYLGTPMGYAYGVSAMHAYVSLPVYALAGHQGGSY